MFPLIEYIKTCLNGLRSRIEKVEKSISQALASVKEDIIQDIKNVQKESAKAIKSSTADWGQNDSNALDYVKNRTHYMLPATPIGSLEFTATSSGTIEYTMTSSEEEFAMFKYFQSLRDKGEVLEVTVGGKTGLLAVTFDRGHFNFNGVFAGTVKWSAGNVLSLDAQNDFITFNQGDTYTASFEDTTTPYYSKLDFNYMPDNVYHSENAPVKFGAGENSTVQGHETTATGKNAHAEGLRTKAIGSEAHAEGSYSEASGAFSHAEGSNTVASGTGAHAEGSNTVASGTGAHAEGKETKADGEAAHAEGNYTVANRKCMHAAGAYNLYDDTKYFDVVSSSKYRFVGRYYAAEEYVFDANTGYYTLVNAELKNVTTVGLYYANPAQYENGTIDHLMKPVSQISGALHNVEDHDSTLGTSLRGKYVHVVGNGDSSARSNAYTLDWDGNGWFAGDVFVGGASQDEGVKLLKAGEAIPIPQTASAGQTIVVKSVDENGKPTEWEPATLPEQVQADWNQNDSSAVDYVKNRTHYEESAYVDYVLNMAGIDIVGFSMPEVGETTTVKINGVESVEAVKEAESSLMGGISYKYIGNTDLDSLLTDGTGWLVEEIQGQVVVGFANPDTTIAVEGIVVHKINDKFINFDGFVRTFDYYFKVKSIYKILYNDAGDECILYTCSDFILPEENAQLFGFMDKIGFSAVGSIKLNSCFVMGFIINNVDGSITIQNTVFGTDTSEMEELAASYGFTHTTNPKA